MLQHQVEEAVKASDYDVLVNIFGNNTTSNSWNTLTSSGDRRALSAHFIKLCVNTPSFLSNALNNEQAREVMKTTLAHLPSSVPNAADNILRNRLFTHLVEEEEDFRAAANVLAGMRMDEYDDPTSVYYTSPQDKTDIYVKIAECFIAEDEMVEAETAVTKAGAAIEGVENAMEEHMALVLRYKAAYAQILDSNRKFLQAASRYYDLSQVNANMEKKDDGSEMATEEIDEDDLVEFLGRATTCAVLAPSGGQRKRVLGLIYKDERLSQLDSLESYQTHSTMLKKMYMNHIIHRKDCVQFEGSLADHQRVQMSDGFTILERAVIEHNMVAISQVYKSIYFVELGSLLGVDMNRVEKVAAKMIMDGSIRGSMDEVKGVLDFDDDTAELINWDHSIASFCTNLNKATDAVRQA